MYVSYVIARIARCLLLNSVTVGWVLDTSLPDVKTVIDYCFKDMGEREDGIFYFL